MQKYINLLNKDNFLKILIAVICLDVVFGVLRAIKEKDINSTIGIDGILRKVGMLVTIMICLFIDTLIDINLIGFIPKEAREFIHLLKLGIGDFFGLLYIIFEALSVLKNMYKMKLPVPKFIQKALEKLLKDVTSEIK